MGRKKDDPGNYIIPAQDHHGHTARIACRVQPTVERQIDVVVQSKKFPFRGEGDFMRWAVWEGLKEIEKRSDCPNNFLLMAENNIALARDAVYWHTFQTSLDTLQKTVEMHISSGSEGEALGLLADAKANALKMEEDVWREKYLKEMERRFGHIWERFKGKRATLGWEEEGEGEGKGRG